MHSVFHPGSPQATAIAHLWWWMAAVGGVVWVAVVAAMVSAVHAQRRGDASVVVDAASSERDRARRMIGAAVFVTVLILGAFLAYDFAVGRALAARPSRALTIDVTGHQWWWEIEYESPDVSKRLVTANEIHVPVGELIQVKLRAADVIHSFWAPNLNGKRDLIPGYMSTLWFKADTPGVYRGQCAEFCGLQHAKMAFYVVADPPDRYAAWRLAAATPDTLPVDSTAAHGRAVFLASGCPLCHSIGGTDARGTVGPSLSHLQSRSTLAAGTLTNTQGHLREWIANPSALKPGVRMPAYPLTPSDLDAVVAYLETLK
jgi:cytochrome c oxidase subunit 2